jgi:ParB-like chromosome segregation protein Spo0J
MKVEMKRLDSLTPYARNPKAHPPEQVQKIAASIREFGFLVPCVIDSQGVIVAGHGRYEAARLLDMAEVPTVNAGNLSPDQIKAFRIADNKVAESDWMEEALQEELRELHAAGYNLDLTGFTLETITGADDELEKRILSEQEPPPQEETGIADITRQIQERIQEIAAADPQRLKKSKAIILPLKRGSRSCFILVDPNTADAIRELQRYHAAGETSPLDCLFRSIFSMKPEKAEVKP